ncbi:hypothetical protein [Tardiphaga sp.]|jgi:hypothetical protein|uniref:hypothetical protein n=1 Tax=Tardiphaga sp. TaxID=1926292 RepID=UPI0037DA6E6D
MKTVFTLGNVQIQRTAALPAKLADNALRTVALDAIQRRNAVLDAVFYDIGVITDDETPELAFWLAREGTVLVVPPTGQGHLRLFLTAEDFLQDGGAVAALAVAGVGSSAIGAAAFARNVADALGGQVAAVVSGYGLADVLTEALGGFFWFGALNSMRHMFESLDDATKLFTKTERKLEATDGLAFTRTSKDTQTLIALLTDERFQVPLLVGHSKGNLVISEALYAIAHQSKEAAADLATRSRVVTFNAKIGVPLMFRKLDVVGQWDWFGALNSRPDIKAALTVPRAWHSTNTDFPMHMGIPVTATLRQVLPLFEDPVHQSGPSMMPDFPQLMTAAMRGPPLLSVNTQGTPA